MKYSKIEYLKQSPFIRSEMWFFMVAAQEKNISRAAEYIGISQPQLSKAMTSLEVQIGQKLFLRQSRGIELTPEGEKLLRNLEKVSESIRNFNQIENPEVIQIGFHHSIGMQIYPRILHTMNLNWLSPNSPRIEVSFATSLEVTRLVADLSLDFGFVINPQKHPDIVAKKIESDQINLFGVGNLKNLEIIYYNPAMLHIQRSLKKFKNAKVIPLADYELIGMTASLHPNCAGILPGQIAKRYQLKPLLAADLLKVDLAVIAHKEKLQSPFLKETFNQMQQGFQPIR